MVIIKSYRLLYLNSILKAGLLLTVVVQHYAVDVYS